MHASYFANIAQLSRLRSPIDDRSAWGISLFGLGRWHFKYNRIDDSEAI
jgi:hypothetical protein